MRLFLPLLLAFAVGALLPIQPAINAELRLHTRDAVLATLGSLTVSFLAVVLVLAVLRPPLPSLADLAQAPWWAWLGGLIGALFVVVSLVLAPRLGAVLLVTAVVAGQLLSSAVIDHFGWFGLEARPLGLLRVVGLVVVALGVAVVQLGTPASRPRPAAAEATVSDR